jgi:AraC-like DNA-binding protein
MNSEHDLAEVLAQLLAIFAQHISMLSNQIVVRQENAEPPAILKAKEFIREHEAGDLSLGQVAQAVNTSRFYFCKLFKKITVVNFTHYVSRVRIEKAKDLLLNPNRRISEIAYEVGFQSLTHFNRVFGRCSGGGAVAQPPCNIWQASGMLRHAHRAEGLGGR